MEADNNYFSTISHDVIHFIPLKSQQVVVSSLLKLPVVEKTTFEPMCILYLAFTT